MQTADKRRLITWATLGFLVVLFLTGCPKKGSRPRPPIPPAASPTPIVQPTAAPTPPVQESTPTSTPTPEISPTPVVTPTPEPSPSMTPIPRATPHPTPQVDPESYFVPIPDGTMAIVSGPNLSEKIQAAQDNPEIAKVRIEGGGSITGNVILRKYTEFDSSTYSCDISQEKGIIQGIPITDYGVFLIADGVRIEGTWRPPTALDDYFKAGAPRDHDNPLLLAVQALTKEELAGTGTTILEPNYVSGSGTGAPGDNPAIEVFQALGDACCSHTEKSANISIRGIHIKGRQRVYDGGVRSTILLGNCNHCTAQYNYLEDTGSIGITFGGSGLEKNNFANDVVAWRNVLSGVAAANIATINTENARIYENYVRRPGHRDPRFGGGVCGYDHETNSEADHTKNIWYYNNLSDYEDAAFESVGSAICAQDPYVGKKQATNESFIVNNVAIGGRDDRVHRFMSNGIFLVGLRGFTVANNYVFRTGQNAIQAYNISGGLIQDNDFESTGGSGNVSFQSEGMSNTVLRRNNYRDRPGLAINVAAGFIDFCGSENIFEQNFVNGVDRPDAVLAMPCAGRAAARGSFKQSPVYQEWLKKMEKR